MKSYTVRDWVLVGLFGALWGVVELTLGTYLNIIFPSFTNTFFKGVILGGIGVAVALTGRFFVPKRGSVFLIGVITALLKLLSPGGSRIGPILAITMQSVLMELVLSTVGDLRAWAFMLSGALAVGWNFPHKFVMMRVMYGRNIVQVYQKLAQDGSQMLGIDASAALLILAILLVVRLVIGGIAGWGAWALGGAVARRLGQRTQLASS
jgi:ABC-type thiamin/hydroxymethylpyrimidine transport system permease subunit